jgi:hypothetical protein
VTAADLASLGDRGDVTARAIETPSGTLYFGALGDRVTGVGDAVRAVKRILV